jgi:DNA-directed RNA polymerase subunit RPC12/RpoP
MAYPIKVCVICKEEFELKPGKPGFANRCPDCTAEEMEKDPSTKRRMDADERRSTSEQNEARRAAIRDMLYKKDS